MSKTKPTIDQERIANVKTLAKLLWGDVDRHEQIVVAAGELVVDPHGQRLQSIVEYAAGADTLTVVKVLMAWARDIEKCCERPNIDDDDDWARDVLGAAIELADNLIAEKWGPLSRSYLVEMGRDASHDRLSASARVEAMAAKPLLSFMGLAEHFGAERRALPNLTGWFAAGYMIAALRAQEPLDHRFQQRLSEWDGLLSAELFSQRNFKAA